jgi:hypothetical protein
MTTTIETTDLLIPQACTQCVKHPGMLVPQGHQDGRWDGVDCYACNGSLVMVQPVPMPTKERGEGWSTNTPWSSPSDLAFYDSLNDAVKAYLKDEFGTIATKYHGQGTLIGGESGWSEGYCTNCYEYVETAEVIYNLRWEAGSDLPTWDESEEICTDCGEAIYFRDEDAAHEAAREDAAERAWEARREGW